MVQVGKQLLTEDAPQSLFTALSVSRPISRRLFLTGGALFGTTATPLVRAASAAISHRVTLKRNSHGIVLDAEGATFAISPADFGAQAKLAVVQAGTRWEITLSHARFPGSDLSANFRAVSNLKNGVRVIEFHFPDWNYRAQAPLAGWIWNRTTLKGQATWNAQAHKNGVALHMVRAQSLEFAPDFSFAAHNAKGEAVAQWQTGDESGAASRITFGLLRADKRGLGVGNAPHRSFWKLERGEHRWPASKLLAQLAVLQTRGETFDTFNFELGETVNGTRSLALLANSKSPSPALWVKPDAGSRIALRNPYFLTAHQGNHTQTALLGWIAPSLLANRNGEAEWQLGLDGDGETPFWMETRDAQLLDWNCEGHITEFHSAPHTAQAEVHLVDFETPTEAPSSLSRSIVVGGGARARIEAPLELQQAPPVLRIPKGPIVVPKRPIVVPEREPETQREPAQREPAQPEPAQREPQRETPPAEPAPQREAPPAAPATQRETPPAEPTPQRETPQREAPTTPQRETPPTPAKGRRKPGRKQPEENPPSKRNPREDTPTTPPKRGGIGGLGDILKRLPRKETETEREDTEDRPVIPSQGRITTERTPTIKIPSVIKIPPVNRVPPVAPVNPPPPTGGINPGSSSGSGIIRIPPVNKIPPVVVQPGKLPNLGDLLKTEVEFVRPDDLLKLRFRFVGLSISGDKLGRTTTGNAYVIVEWDALSLAEDVFPTSGNPQLPAENRAGGVSSLAFLVPSTFNNVPLTLANLLDWDGWTAVNPAPGSGVHNPLEASSPESALELPYRLQMAPLEKVTWLHSKTPKKANGAVELWHTRAQNATGTPIRMRVVNALESPAGFKTTLDNNDRQGLAKLMVASSRWFEAENLMLSTLGGFLRGTTRGLGWNNDPSITISSWNQRTSLGRDHYMRLEKEGYLFPLGHRAALITIVERTFETINGAKVALLRERKFIVLRENIKDYRTGLSDFMMRQMPFQQAEILMPVSPNLDTSKAVVTPFGQPKPLMWPLAGVDETGKRTEWSMPLVWVQRGGADAKPQKLPLDGTSVTLQGNNLELAIDLANVWNKSNLGDIDFGGQKLAFAPPKSEGDTTFTTKKMRIGAGAIVPAVAGNPAFSPQVLHADIDVPALQNLGAATAGTTRVAFAEPYRKTGFGTGNVGEALLQMVKGEGDFKSLLPNPVSLALGASKGGGLAQTAMDMTGLSRLKGPVGGDLLKIAANQFNPKEYFGSMLDEARLLGSLKLSDVLKATGLDLGQAPKMLTETIDAAKEAIGEAKQAVNDAKQAINDGKQAVSDAKQAIGELSLPKEIRTTLKWETNGWNTDNPALMGLFVPSSQTKLVIDGLIVVKQSGQTSTIKGRLNDFALDFFSFVRVSFVNLEFIAQSGQKLDINCDLAKENAVTFGGPLSFIQTLASIIPADRFSDPPSLDVSPSGITAGYTLAAPDIAAGAWAISNMSFGAALTIPFSSDPCRLRFNFSERNDPFAVTAYGLTGGGFFALSLGTEGIERLEASFEIGGSLKLNFGVVKGGVYIMAGIYFELRQSDKAVVLAGYVRAGGAMSVLGLVSMSLEMLMQLSYDSSSNMVRGEVSMKVKVSVAFFSKSVSFTAHKEFEAPAAVKNAFDTVVAQNELPRTRLAALELGSSDDATSEVDDYWARYCAAFA